MWRADIRKSRPIVGLDPSIVKRGRYQDSGHAPGLHLPDIVDATHASAGVDFGIRRLLGDKPTDCRSRGPAPLADIGQIEDDKPTDANLNGAGDDGAGI